VIAHGNDPAGEGDGKAGPIDRSGCIVEHRAGHREPTLLDAHVANVIAAAAAHAESATFVHVTSAAERVLKRPGMVL
jgi:hypothetical protein